MADIFSAADLQYIKGIGPKRAEILQKIGIFSLIDLLEYFPRRYIDRSKLVKIADVRVDDSVTVFGEVIATHVQAGRRKRLIVTIKDDSGYLQGIWFNGIRIFEKFFKKNQMVSFHGKIGFYNGYQILHPDFDILSDDNDASLVNTAQIIPLYPSGELLRKNNLSSYWFRKIFKQLMLSDAVAIPDIVPAKWREDIPTGLHEAFKQAHFPDTMETLKTAVYYLKYNELLAIQCLVAIRYQEVRLKQKAQVFQPPGPLLNRLKSLLPFALTSAQDRVVTEITEDMQRDIPMHRLLQGDVGSGKTVVALVSALHAIENGKQVVLMVPTEILAEQHFISLQQYLKKLELRIGLFKGKMHKKYRELLLQHIGSGHYQMIVGTHALFSEDVSFNDLGLVIIDEQHRFGVEQRRLLMDKGLHPHTLVMTATPIPRTLTMTVYGDLDLSVIDELPPGRLPVKTAWRQDKSRKAIAEFITKELVDGRQVFVVYPLIEESEKLDIAAAEKGFEQLKQRFSTFSIALLHGKIEQKEREAIMADFKDGKIHILVATTVIEVGIDIPNASIMLIENAERFGLSQLHQLRGRIGRGQYQSYCILLTADKITENAEARMEAMVASDDGFFIAEKDWEIRGAGEFFGTRQSGYDDLKIANLVTDQHILERAKEAAFRIVQEDPRLQNPDHASLRHYIWHKYKDKLAELNLH
jgi:ATP-dependent DNA helicase RecG